MVVQRMYGLWHLVLLACCSLTGGSVAAATWSGELIIEQQLKLPLANADEREEWDLVISEWQASRQVAVQRLADMPESEVEQRRLLNADIAAFTSQIEDAQRQRGGTILLGRQRYVSDQLPVGQVRPGQGRLLLQFDERNLSDAGRTLVIDHSLGKAWYSDDAEDRRSVDPVVSPAAREDLGMGEPILDRPTRRYELMLDDQKVIVDVLPDLPNVYAYGHLEYHEDDVLAVELARLPGLPARLRLGREQGTMTLAVVAIHPAEQQP